MTLFCGFFTDNLKFCTFILDTFMEDGWAAIYRISISILKHFEAAILTANDV